VRLVSRGLVFVRSRRFSLAYFALVEVIDTIVTGAIGDVESPCGQSDMRTRGWIDSLIDIFFVSTRAGSCELLKKR
jgi:hypothetical protein